jgi:hypothetical protein
MRASALARPTRLRRFALRQPVGHPKWEKRTTGGVLGTSFPSSAVAAGVAEGDSLASHTMLQIMAVA